MNWGVVVSFVATLWCVPGLPERSFEPFMCLDCGLLLHCQSDCSGH